MSTRTTPFAVGTPCWVNLISSDTAVSNAFYQGLFGWTAEDMGAEYGHYTNYYANGQLVAGLMTNDPSFGAPDSWTTYLAVTDVDSTVAAATAAGGQVLMPGLQVGDRGSMAVLADPAGAVFGLWQAAAHTGFQRYSEPGTVIWDEVHSKDFAATAAFYPAVFGWSFDKTSDTDEFRYYTAEVDGAPVAGLMDSASFLPPEVPSHWEVYFNVADADAAVATAASLGAAVVKPAQDTPFGRIAELRDPTGASFNLHAEVASA